MVKILKYRLFEDESSQVTFTSAQFDDFCKWVKGWQDKTKQTVVWSFYSTSDEGYSNKKADALRNWNVFVPTDKVFTLVEMDDKLVGVIRKDKEIVSAYDNMNQKVENTQVQPLIFPESTTEV